MTYRNRPAPRRRHRARWQDELRTQRLLVGAFAAAIAIALGLFLMSAWNAYYDSHLRQVIVVDDTRVTAEDYDLRQAMITAELQAIGLDFQGQLGGARDAILNQQLSAVSDQFSNLTSVTTDSLVDGIFQASQAPTLGIEVTEEEVDAEVAHRTTLPARIQFSAITVNALPDDAASGDEPTDADFARAEDEATAIKARLDAGEDFGAVATEVSDDPASAQAGGLVGWVEEDDVQYAYLFPLAEGHEIGEVSDPTRTDFGYVIFRVDGRTEAGPFTTLNDALDAARVTDADYRQYVSEELMREAFRDHFATEVVVSPAPQREFAQILVLDDQGVPVPKQRIRHLLAQPLPDSDDQSTATDAEWAAALARAEAWYDEVQDPNADWFEIARDSDDPGSRSNGGDLGWTDPTSSGFVQEFQDAITSLGVGEISEPVRTEFGYHVIQVTDTRTTAMGFVDDLITEIEADPDAFGALAREHSEDTGTRQDDGRYGWAARYELDPDREEAIWGLAEPGDFTTEPVVDGTQLWLFKLLSVSESRGVEESRLNTIRNVGYSRWYDELKATAQIWIDTQLQLDSSQPDGAPVQ
ncbi:MAG TPA: peptidylprolyl isomerase [Candidatus Limnocylindria bacterium]